MLEEKQKCGHTQKQNETPKKEKPYFGESPDDLEALLTDFIDCRATRVSSSKAEI